MKPVEYLKAIVGGVLAGLTSAGVALSDGHITAAEGVMIATAAVLSFAAVFGIPNSPTV